MKLLSRDTLTKHILSNIMYTVKCNEKKSTHVKGFIESLGFGETR